MERSQTEIAGLGYWLAMGGERGWDAKDDFQICEMGNTGREGDTRKHEFGGES